MRAAILVLSDTACDTQNSLPCALLVFVIFFIFNTRFRRALALCGRVLTSNLAD